MSTIDKQLADAFAFCLQYYSGINANEFLNDKHLIDFTIHKLTDIDVGKLLFEGDNWKYFAQLESIDGSKEKGKAGQRLKGINISLTETKNDAIVINFNGWSQKSFLALRIRSFFEIALLIEVGVIYPSYIPFIRKDIKTIESKDKVLALIKKEIKEMLTTFSLIKQLNEINKLEKEEKINQKNILAENLSQRILSLNLNDELTLATGWSGHAIYVSFMAYENSILIRVDNLGEGREPIHSGPVLHIPDKNRGKPDRFFSALGLLEKSKFQNTGAIYLKTLFDTPSKEIKEGYTEIYDPSFINFTHPDEIQKLIHQLNYPSAKKQASGNCPVKNHQIGMQIRLGKSDLFAGLDLKEAHARRRELYKFIRRQEHQIANPKRFTRDPGNYVAPSIYKEYTTFWAQPRNLPNTLDLALRKFYTDPVFNHIKRLFNNKPIAIQPHYINLSIVKTAKQKARENLLTKRSLQKKRKFTEHEQYYNVLEEIYDSNTPETIDINKIFAPESKRETNRILISGRAGIGKTILCKYLVYQWGQKAEWIRDFNAVILIQFRNLTEKNYPLLQENTTYSYIDIVRNEIIKPLSQSTISIDSLTHQLKNSKILWVLDGRDELPNPVPKQLAEAIDTLLKMENYIITTRPQYAESIVSDTSYEIVGFKNNNIEEYIKDFFEIPSLINNEEKVDIKTQSARDLFDTIHHPGIWGICHIPILLEILCSTWSDNVLKKSDKPSISITFLYYKSLIWLLRRYDLKQKNQIIEEKKEDEFILLDRYKNHLNILGQIAFEATQNQEVIIEPALLQKIFNPLYDKNVSLELNNQNRTNLLSEIIDIGLLKPLNILETSSSLLFETRYYFVHLSFQEFMSAWYLSNNLNRNTLFWLKENKYIKYYGLVLSFLTGLLGNSIVSTADEKQIEERKIRNKLLWNAIQELPRDIVNILHLQLIIQCCEELDSTPTEIYFEINLWLNTFISKIYIFEDMDDFLYGFKYCPRLLKNNLGKILLKPLIDNNIKYNSQAQDFSVKFFINTYHLLGNQEFFELLDKILQLNFEKYLPQLKPLIVQFTQNSSSSEIYSQVIHKMTTLLLNKKTSINSSELETLIIDILKKIWSPEKATLFTDNINAAKKQIRDKTILNLLDQLAGPFNTKEIKPRIDNTEEFFIKNTWTYLPNNIREILSDEKPDNEKMKLLFNYAYIENSDASLIHNMNNMHIQIFHRYAREKLIKSENAEFFNFLKDNIIKLDDEKHQSVEIISPIIAHAISILIGVTYPNHHKSDNILEYILKCLDSNDLIVIVAILEYWKEDTYNLCRIILPKYNDIYIKILGILDKFNKEHHDSQSFYGKMIELSVFLLLSIARYSEYKKIIIEQLCQKSLVDVKNIDLYLPSILAFSNSNEIDNRWLDKVIDLTKLNNLYFIDYLKNLIEIYLERPSILQTQNNILDSIPSLVYRKSYGIAILENKIIIFNKSDTITISTIPSNKNTTHNKLANLLELINSFLAFRKDHSLPFDGLSQYSLMNQSASSLDIDRKLTIHNFLTLLICKYPTNNPNRTYLVIEELNGFTNKKYYCVCIKNKRREKELFCKRYNTLLELKDHVLTFPKAKFRSWKLDYIPYKQLTDEINTETIQINHSSTSQSTNRNRFFSNYNSYKWLKEKLQKVGIQVPENFSEFQNEAKDLVSLNII